MAYITFYLLTSTTSSVEHIACRLTAKAWREGHSVHIHTSNAKTSQQLDKLLWNWQEDSFLPHRVLNDQETRESTPITISHTLPNKPTNGILINLAPTAIGNADNYQRVCEIVTQDSDGKALSREKFRSYRQAGIQPKTYQL